MEWNLKEGILVAEGEAQAHAGAQTTKKQVIRISILQSSKIVTVLYILMGFIYTLIGIPMMILGGREFRVIGIVYALMPVIMGVVGLLFFVIFAALYNGLATWLGGVEIEIKNME